jgi:hypothetical protein
MEAEAEGRQQININDKISSSKAPPQICRTPTETGEG